ncbi:MAG: hypothetical protein FJ405_10935 [Verrucomicrobia bacterium]|nr:hypothetical protein [Verrucomicrobiota bacterium]
MTPLVLITGFLGSGKTSLLRQLLPQLKAGGARPHVILNDYVNAQLDSDSLRDIVEDIRPITGSCVCCNSMEQLLGTLEDLQLDGGDVVLVEANGTTDPLPLLESFVLSNRLKSRFTCVQQVVLVDQKRWQRRGHHNELERMQVRTATHWIATWCDAVDTERAESTVRDVAKVNSRVRKTTADEYVNELLALIQSGEDARDVNQVRLAPRLQLHGGGFGVPGVASRGGSSLVAGLPKLSTGHDHSLAHRFTALQIPLARGLHPLQVVGWLSSLPSEVIRAKGVVEFAGQPDRFHIFQRVEDQVSFKESLLRPASDHCLAILVGVGLDETALTQDAMGRLGTPAVSTHTRNITAGSVNGRETSKVDE